MADLAASSPSYEGGEKKIIIELSAGAVDWPNEKYNQLSQTPLRPTFLCLHGWSSVNQPRL